ncbi:DUF2637 domain-containing protein [Actinomadura chibensis]|uniref:DUF2637 domain-containing protein n=1 Tax=Actinomadura chibensis TaxID=392828 RepID=UPI001472437D
MIAVAAVAAAISYAHAFDLVRSHGTGVTARLIPLPVDGLIWVASMVILDSSRRHRPVPALARWSPAAGICATVARTWRGVPPTAPSAPSSTPSPPLILVGSFELLMAVTHGTVPRRAAAPTVNGTALDPLTSPDEEPTIKGCSGHRPTVIPASGA